MPFSSQVNGDLKVCFSKIWHLFANGKPHEIGFSRVWHDAPPSRAVESWCPKEVVYTHFSKQ